MSTKPKKTAPLRHRKVLRDNIQGLAKGQFKRLAHKAGVKSMSNLCYEELRGVTKVQLEYVMKNAIALSQHRRAKIVSLEDILGAIKQTSGKDFAYTHAHLKVTRC